MDDERPSPTIEGPGGPNVSWEHVDTDRLDWRQSSDFDWKDEENYPDDAPDTEDRREAYLEKREEFLEARDPEIVDKIENPDPDVEHEVSALEAVVEKMIFEPGPDGVFQVVDRERQHAEGEDSFPEFYRCSCGAVNMTGSEAKEHYEQAHK